MCVQAKRRRARTPTPGQYLGVRSLRSTRDFGYSQGRHGERGSYDDTRNGGSSRDSRSPYRNGPDSPYRGRSGYRHDSQDRHVGRGSYDDSPQDSHSPSPNARGSPYNRRSRYRHSHGTPSRSRSITPVYTKERRWGRCSWKGPWLTDVIHIPVYHTLFLMTCSLFSLGERKFYDMFCSVACGCKDGRMQSVHVSFLADCYLLLLFWLQSSCC